MMTRQLMFWTGILCALPLAQPRPDGPRVALESAAGVVRELDLEELNTADPRELGAHLLRFIEMEGKAGTRRNLAELELVSGDRLRASIRGGKGEVLQLELLGNVRQGLAVDALRSLRVLDRIPEGWAGSLEPAPLGDRLYRRTHSGLDRIDGTLVEFSSEGLVMDGQLGEKLFEWREVAALFVEVFEDEFGDEESKLVPVVLDLVDSSRVTGGLIRLDGTTCALDIRGETIEFPTWVLAELLVNDGALKFLSDIQPTKVEEPSPFGDDLGMKWPYRVDRSVTGEPLKAGGVTYTRGLGVHAPSRLTWALDGEWNELRGSVAIDDQVRGLPANGSVIFRVLLDGKPAFESRVMKGGDSPLAIPSIVLSEASELALEVDMATDFHVADRADWLRVLLVR